mmetsp:Transcript_26901/g.73959  ORF Transcript_26901/g.73959 Transcript_26901/m.73959 type:complete len:85 (-) Transcript_26901:209-463(-)
MLPFGCSKCLQADTNGAAKLRELPPRGVFKVFEFVKLKFTENLLGEELLPFLLVIVSLLINRSEIGTSGYSLPPSNERNPCRLC